MFERSERTIRESEANPQQFGQKHKLPHISIPQRNWNLMVELVLFNEGFSSSGRVVRLPTSRSITDGASYF